MTDARVGRVWVIHPPLIAAYPVVALYAQNVYFTRPGDLLLPLAVTTAASLVLWLALWASGLGAARGGLVATIALGAFHLSSWAPGALDQVLYWLSHLWVRTLVETPPWVSVGPLLASAGAVAYLAAFRLRDTRRLTSFLNVFAALLVAMPAEWAARRRGAEPPTATEAAVRAWVPPAPALKPRPGPRGRPDIYYIILDGFARPDVLAEVFGLDLAPTLERLERKGFYVARRATSNYAQTPLSIASSLNARYLDGVAPPDQHDSTFLHEAIGGGAVVDALRGAGYTFVSFSTGFDQTELHDADRYLSPYPQVRGFHRMLLSGTPLFWRLLPNPMQHDSYTMTRDRTLYVFATLPEIARDPAPTFAFAHVLGPHPPFVFGEDGRDVSPHQTRYYLSDGSAFHSYYGPSGYAAGYRGEAAYLARRVEEVVGQILAASPEPPVILIQSDHGSGLRLDTASAENTDVRERMSILSAYYFPGGDYRGLDPGITPVNSFRVVFNTLFGTNLPRLPDRNYFSDWIQPFEFLDVTDRVNAAGPGGGTSGVRGVSGGPAPALGGCPGTNITDAR